MPFAPHPVPPLDTALERVAAVLDPVLQPLGFAPGQKGGSEVEAQVVFCRGSARSGDGECEDLVVELRPVPEWRITDVRYWGHPSGRWHLLFARDADLAAQLSELALTLEDELT